MWDSNAPLQLLKSMPKKLTKENLEKLQLVIEADKYKNSLLSGFDLCGMYAPFCSGCKRASIYPCAISYVNMLKAEGMDIEIDARPVSASGNFTPAPSPQDLNEVVAASAVDEEESVVLKVVEEEKKIKQPEAHEATTPEKVFVDDTVIETHSEVKPHNKKIRIAVARKKI